MSNALFTFKILTSFCALGEKILTQQQVQQVHLESKMQHWSHSSTFNHFQHSFSK
jgi:hypothetical protein